jgi:hypothetical protein
MNVHQVDLATRLAIVGELWRAGVRTDLQYDDERGFNDIVEECSEQNTLCVLLVSGTFLATHHSASLSSLSRLVRARWSKCTMSSDHPPRRSSSTVPSSARTCAMRLLNNVDWTHRTRQPKGPYRSPKLLRCLEVPAATTRVGKVRSR